MLSDCAKGTSVWWHAPDTYFRGGFFLFDSDGWRARWQVPLAYQNFIANRRGVVVRSVTEATEPAVVENGEAILRDARTAHRSFASAHLSDGYGSRRVRFTTDPLAGQLEVARDGAKDSPRSWRSCPFQRASGHCLPALSLGEGGRVDPDCEPRAIR